jgi:hypothetical protein
MTRYLVSISFIILFSIENVYAVDVYALLEAHCPPTSYINMCTNLPQDVCCSFHPQTGMANVATSSVEWNNLGRCNMASWYTSTATNNCGGSLKTRYMAESFKATYCMELPAGQNPTVNDGASWYVSREDLQMQYLD